MKKRIRVLVELRALTPVDAQDMNAIKPELVSWVVESKLPLLYRSKLLFLPLHSNLPNIDSVLTLKATFAKT